MIYFTIKDIVKYNLKCKICSSPTSLYLVDDMPCDEYNYGRLNVIKPTINNGIMSFNISIKYKSKILLHIDIATNEFILIKEGVELYNEKFLDQIFLETICDTCGTMMNTEYLVFSKNTIKPVKLFTEAIFINHNNINFSIFNKFKTNKCAFIAIGQNIKSTNIELPLMPLWKFKNRKAIIEKLNFIMAIS